MVYTYVVWDLHTIGGFEDGKGGLCPLKYPLRPHEWWYSR